ncbi:MAG: MoaD/ThiS family protein [Verrucomicrobiae bacterium]|nr:MoaD/ThiS family protein [Verrucomicrobiae bacterium]
MKVLYFASASLAAGCREEIWTLERSLTVEEFWREAVRRHPGLATLRPICRLARNQVYAEEDAHFANDDEAAVLPPVSGG